MGFEAEGTAREAFGELLDEPQDARIARPHATRHPREVFYEDAGDVAGRERAHADATGLLLVVDLDDFPDLQTAVLGLPSDERVASHGTRMDQLGGERKYAARGRRRFAVKGTDDP